MSTRCRGHRGFTLVEVVVAIMVLSVGVLGAVGATATLVRWMGDAARRSRADSAARLRMEWLAARSCATLGDGAVRGPGVEERWTVRPDSVSRVAQVAVEATVGGGAAPPGRTYVAAYASIVPC